MVRIRYNKSIKKKVRKNKQFSKRQKNGTPKERKTQISKRRWDKKKFGDLQ